MSLLKSVSRIRRRGCRPAVDRRRGASRRGRARVACAKKASRGSLSGGGTLGVARGGDAGQQAGGGTGGGAKTTADGGRATPLFSGGGKKKMNRKGWFCNILKFQGLNYKIKFPVDLGLK